MTAPDYRFIDSDTHCYEPEDCFTRHLEKKYRDRAIELGPPEADGRRAFHFDGKRVLPHYFEGIMGPGTWKDLMSHWGKGTMWEEESAIAFSPEHPDFRDRDERLAWMDAQNIEAAILNSTLSCDFLATTGDMPLLYAHQRAFNRHLEDDWGYRYQNRIFAAPHITLDDRELAIEELERLIREEVKFVNFPPRNAGNRSPADPYFDPFWARLAEAGIVPIVHLGNGGTLGRMAAWSEGPEVIRTSNNGNPGFTAFQWMTSFVDRPVMDFLTALILHNLFGRFPDLRVISIEYGIAWVPYLLSQLDKCYRVAYDMEWIGGRPADLPSEIFKRHVSLTAFFEDKISEIMELLGPGRLLLGSDYPHPEGVAEPAEFLGQLPGQSEAVVRAFMRDNAAALYGLAA